MGFMNSVYSRVTHCRITGMLTNKFLQCASLTMHNERHPDADSWRRMHIGSFKSKNLGLQLQNVANNTILLNLSSTCDKCAFTKLQTKICCALINLFLMEEYDHTWESALCNVALCSHKMQCTSHSVFHWVKYLETDSECWAWNSRELIYNYNRERIQYNLLYLYFYLFNFLGEWYLTGY